MSGCKKKVGVVICGFGRAGQIHFNGVRKNCRCKLLYVVDRVEEDEAVKNLILNKLEQTLTEGVKVVGLKNYENEVLKDPNVDAIIVTTPTNQHEYYVRTALAAEKAVFCEKPIAVEREAIVECYDMAERVKRPLFCAFNRRFDPGMSSVRDQVRGGKVGTLYQVNTTSRDSPLPSMAYLAISRGIFHDCAVHDIDMACWIAGEAPCSVFAQGSAFHPEIREMGDVDTVAIVLKFPSGVISSIDLSRHASYGYDQRLEVYGSKGMLQVENIPEKPVKSFSEAGGTTPPLHFSFPQRYEQAYLIEMDLFLDVVTDPSLPCPVTKESVLLAGRVADACEKSLKEGCVVTLDTSS